MIGTAIGAFFWWVTYYAWHGHYLLYGLAVGICIFIGSALNFDKAGRLAAVALTIVVLVKLDAGPGQAAIALFRSWSRHHSCAGSHAARISTCAQRCNG